MQKISYCLWFDTNAEEAAKFYTATFDHSSIGMTSRYSKASAAASGRPEGSPMMVTFHLDGEEFMGLNGGPVFKFTPAISFFVACNTEDEIDRLYRRLSEGGSVLMELNKYPFSEKFGWVNDQFGVSWQLNLAVKAQKISPALMFIGDKHGKAEEAVNFYASKFKNSHVVNIARYGAESGEQEGRVSHAVFSLNGQEFIAMDSGIDHAFSITPAISFVCPCETQEEIDYLWNTLSSDGGAPEQCGWLTDKYGVSWQIIPSILGKLMTNPERSEKVMSAMMQMTKLDIATLQQASNQ